MNIKYQILNEVLIEWNASSKGDSDNIFLKSEDIKKSLDRCFIYKLDEKDRIKIFAYQWRDFEKYKNKVWINDKHVKLDYNGYTVDWFEPGEYKVYIENIDKITNTARMFSMCKQLVFAFIPKNIKIIGFSMFNNTNLTSIIIPNSVKKISKGAFYMCTNLTSVTIPASVKQIYDYAFWGCKNLKTVYVEDINKFNQMEFEGALGSNPPTCYGAKVIELKK